MTLRIVNEGEAVHNLSIGGVGMATPILEPGEVFELVLNLPAGQYTIGCDVPGHKMAGMIGVLRAA